MPPNLEDEQAQRDEVAEAHDERAQDPHGHALADTAHR